MNYSIKKVVLLSAINKLENWGLEDLSKFAFKSYHQLQQNFWGKHTFSAFGPWPDNYAHCLPED